MLKANVQKAIDRIAKDMLALAQVILEDDSISRNTKINRNTLANSRLRKDVATYITSKSEEDPVFKTLFDHYVVFLEWDRPKKYKKKPPISVLRDWAANNGIPTDANTLWAISTAIWRDGHTGRPIFATLDKELDGLYLEDWGDDLFNSLVKVTDNFFNS